MMKIIATLLFLVINVVALSAQPDGKKVLKEGQLMYRLEKASWYGTDELLAKYPGKKEKIGGYLSYAGDDSFIYNIFFDKKDNNKIIARFRFDSLPRQTPVFADTTSHTATQKEKDLIAIRQDALERVNSNIDNFFKFYKNTSYNFIPLITPKEKKVYIITAPEVNGVVLLGNDYLLKYNSDGVFVSKERIHNSLVPLATKMDSAKTAEATMHSHIISEIIDPTDICTLLLYKDFAEWKKHYVISDKYVSIFDMEKEELVIIKRKDWEKLNKIQGKDK
jgi:hypothetical protein